MWTPDLTKTLARRRFLGLVPVALALALVAPALLVETGCRRAEEQAPAPRPREIVAALDARHEPLRADFNRASARVRLLILASPT